MAFAFKHLLSLLKEKHLNELMKKEGKEEEQSNMLLGAIGADEGAMAISEDAALQQMEAELTEMFKRADAEGTGVLSASEFHSILRALDLGLSQYQMARLVAEADENEDGEISYAEFVPVGMRFLQAYKAKRSANRHWDEREAEADAMAKDACLKCEAELLDLVGRVELKFAEADAERSGRLPREAFLRCLRAPQRMTRQMANMVAASMRPEEGTGLTPIADFAKVGARSPLSRISRERSLSERSLAPSRLRQGD